MSFILNDDQSLLQESAAVFFAETAPVAQIRQLRDSENAVGFSDQVWNKSREMGFAGLLVAEQFGGLGLGMRDAGIVLENIGRNLSALPFLSSSVLAVSAIELLGNSEQKEKYLPSLASGEKRAALAWEDSAKHQVNPKKTLARQLANAWQLDGEKSNVVDGVGADFYLVSACLGETNQLAVFVVPADAAGLTVERVAMVDARPSARLTFKNVVLALDQCLGLQAASQQQVDKLLDIGRAAVAVEMLGLSEGVFQRTVSYLKERKQFGRIIGQFQALQHRAAELYCDIEMTRAACIKALIELDTNPDGAAQWVAIAKSKAGTTATLAVQEGVQMHGGMGMTDQFDMGLYMKRARVLQELFGDSNFQQERLAQLRGY